MHNLLDCVLNSSLDKRHHKTLQARGSNIINYEVVQHYTTLYVYVTMECRQPITEKNGFFAMAAVSSVLNVGKVTVVRLARQRVQMLCMRSHFSCTMVVNTSSRSKLLQSVWFNSKHTIWWTSCILWTLLDFALKQHMILSDWSDCILHLVKCIRVLTGQGQELIRRWDSERELFTTISHVLQNTKKRTYFV